MHRAGAFLVPPISALSKETEQVGGIAEVGPTFGLAGGAWRSDVGQGLS